MPPPRDVKTRPSIPSAPGTYALLLDIERAGPIPIGGLGEIRFAAQPCLYVGSAFGAGGLAGRLGHHLAPDCRRIARFPGESP